MEYWWRLSCYWYIKTCCEIWLPIVWYCILLWKWVLCGTSFERVLWKERDILLFQLHPDHHGLNERRKTESVKKLDIGAIDLHLIHCPRPGKILETWKAMIEWKKGLSKSIDISDFNIQHVKQITESGMESWNSSMESIGSFSWQLTK